MYEPKPDFLKTNAEVEANIEFNVNNPQSENEDADVKLALFRKRFRAAVEAASKWQEEAKQDYDFVAGKQWTDQQMQDFVDSNRPPIVINKIRPRISIVSGYQRLNRLDITFLARTNDDVELAHVRSGVTKYVLDRCDYQNIESQSFVDCCIGGLGWFGVKFKYDEEIADGEAYVERVDPFSIYVDPEAHELDYSDAKFICRARWTDKDEVKQIYPEKAESIENAFAKYDSIEEDEKEDVEVDPFWYSGELLKIRIVEYWYKVRDKKLMLQLSTGETAEYNEQTQEQLNMLLQSGQVVVISQQEIPVTKVRCCVFFDNILLEDIDSPYQHGEFPYVPIVYHYYGVGDIPAGFVRDMKDPQVEINKRRIQALHIIDNSSGGGGWYEQSAMTPEQQAEFKEKGSMPGHWQQVNEGALTQAKIRERETKQPPAAMINAEQQATSDLTEISGINEQLLAQDVSNSSSGRAIELRTRQAVTNLAVIFDSLRRAKKKIAYLLWGKRGHAGIIPQFYTAEKTMRIEGENGQEYIQINQQVLQQDPIAGPIVRTLNDLSQGEFDIVVSDVEASVTQREADLLLLVDMMSKLGIPGDMIFDLLVKGTNLHDKNDIAERWQQRQQQQQMQAQQQAEAQIRLEEVKNRDFKQAITFKDAPLPIQLAMCAQAGYLDINIANQIMQAWLAQIMPQFTQPIMAQQQVQPPPQMTPEMMMAAMQGQGQMGMQPPQPQPMTQAAAQSIMNGMIPAIG